jgi:uncharacterized protein YjbI with pentapeptide repeats
VVKSRARGHAERPPTLDVRVLPSPEAGSAARPAKGPAHVNPDHVALLGAGAEAVTRHSREGGAALDLSGATLSDLRLFGAEFPPDCDFSGCTLVESFIVRSRLEQARFDGAHLAPGCHLTHSSVDNASFRGATLERAYLVGSHFTKTDFTRARLSRANLAWGTVRFSTFDGADMRGAVLQNVDAHRVSMREAALEGLDLHDTVLTGVDLSGASGLDRLVYRHGNAIDHETVARSGELPRAFYEGCGVPDEVIAFFESIAGAIRFYSAFISYSTVDQPLADRLYADLQASGVRCWLATEDLKIGERIRQGIDEAIRFHDKLLLLLSENSVNSPWVESEVEAALERREQRTVLFPIRLGDAVMSSDRAWASEIRRTRHIGDFRAWKDHDHYAASFERLVRDLKQE